jgi:hypothetical protein
MKFVKHANWIYLFLSILAITSVAVCISVAVDNGFAPLTNYTTFFYSTSFGAFSAQHNKCQYALINTTTQQASLNMSCPYGKVNGSITSATVPAVLTS